jgi:hypothetical protein
VDESLAEARNISRTKIKAPESGAFFRRRCS